MNIQLTDTGMKFYGVTSKIVKMVEFSISPYVIEHENLKIISFTLEDIKTLLDMGFIELID